MSLLVSTVFMLSSSMLACGDVLRHKSDLQGVTISLATLDFPPFDIVTPLKNGNYSHTGSNPMLYQWLGKRLNFIPHFVIFNETLRASFGSSLNLVIYYVANKSCDAISMGAIATPERISKLDYAYFTWTEPHAMVVPRPGEEPRLFAFIRPFQPKVWLIILITFFVMVATMTIFSKSYSARKRVIKINNFRIKSAFYYMSDYFVYVVNTMANQGGSEPYNRTPFRILVGVWLLAATVLVNSYGSTVISYLTVSKTKPHVNTLEDLATSKEIQVIVRNDFIIGQQIMEAQTGAMKILGDQVRLHPERLVTKTLKANELLRTRKFAFPFLASSCNLFVVNEYKKDRECRFLTSDPISMNGYWAMTLQKDSKYTKAFNDALMEVWETGLPFYWVKINSEQAPECFVKPRSRLHSTNQVPIRLKDLTGPFFLYVIGISASTLVFIMEMILKKMLSRSNRLVM